MNAGSWIDRAKPLRVLLTHGNMRVECVQRAMLDVTHQACCSTGVGSSKKILFAFGILLHQFAFDIVPITDNERCIGPRVNNREVVDQMDAFDLNHVKLLLTEQTHERVLHDD